MARTACQQPRVKGLTSLMPKIIRIGMMHGREGEE
jgi:hypothetical protein